MSEHVRRIGQQPSPGEPFYRLIEEYTSFFLVEYCHSYKILDKSMYEKVQP